MTPPGDFQGKAPFADLPAPLRGAEPGSWAQVSITERLPRILDRTFQDNDFPAKVASRLAQLRDEIPEAPIRPIEDPGAPDIDDWARYVQPFEGWNWLEAPWLFVEPYLYRRVIAATGFFDPDPPDWADPFRPEKERALQDGPHAEASAATNLSDHLLASLWGNQADLSLWPTAQGSRPTSAGDRLLADERSAVLSYLEELGRGLRRIDLILDNVGGELVADLGLARRLLQEHPALSVHLHAKLHPTYVSDATPRDVQRTLDHLASSDEEAARALGDELAEQLSEGRLRLRQPFFWTSPSPGWEMPSDLRDDLAGSNLLVFKGDYNYRRLLGDRRWDLTTAFSKVVGYMPAAVVALRSIKADVAIGLTVENIERASRADPDWMTNGQWALIQFARSLNRS